MNVTAPIRHTAERAPNAPAIILANHQLIPYSLLDRLVDAVAERLADHGITPAHTVALAVTGPDEFPGIVTALALARRGIASADLSAPPNRLTLCITEAARPPPPHVRALPIDQLWANLHPATTQGPIHDDPAAILRLMSSSGTTGHAKTAAVTHALVTARLQAFAPDCERHGPVRIIGRGLGADGGFRCVLNALQTGATILLTNPNDVIPAIIRHRVTGFMTTPVTLQRILATMATTPPPPSLALLEITGAPCPTQLRTLAREKLTPTLVAGAGCMECGRLASGPLTNHPEVAMQLKQGVEAQALAPDGTILPPKTPGRLRYRSPGMVPHYENDPALSTKHFQNGWFLSGDIGRIDPDPTGQSWLTITGREADLINSGGVKVAPFIIEDVLLTLPGITEAVAFGAPNSMGVEQIWAAFVATRLIPRQELENHCAPRLGHQTPTSILQLPRLPRTESGKVLRTLLRQYASTRELKT